MYAIIHVWDTDGGFGDPVEQEQVVALCYDKDLADKFVEKYSNSHIYDAPYAYMNCGMLIVEDYGELPIIEEKHLTNRPKFDQWTEDALAGYETDYYRKYKK